MRNYCEQVVHSRYLQLGLQPTPCRPTVAGPTGRQGPWGRSPAVGTYEGWVTSYGVCGHLLDSLSACDHSATLMKPEQAHFGRLYVRMFFRKASPQTEGRRNADLLFSYYSSKRDRHVGTRIVGTRIVGTRINESRRINLERKDGRGKWERHASGTSREIRNRIAEFPRKRGAEKREPRCENNNYWI